MASDLAGSLVCSQRDEGIAEADRADRPVPECKVGVSAQHRLDVGSRGWPVYLGGRHCSAYARKVTHPA